MMKKIIALLICFTYFVSNASSIAASGTFLHEKVPSKHTLRPNSSNLSDESLLAALKQRNFLVIDAGDARFRSFVIRSQTYEERALDTSEDRAAFSEARREEIFSALRSKKIALLKSGTRDLHRSSCFSDYDTIYIVISDQVFDDFKRRYSYISRETPLTESDKDEFSVIFPRYIIEPLLSEIYEYEIFYARQDNPVFELARRIHMRFNDELSVDEMSEEELFCMGLYAIISEHCKDQKIDINNLYDVLTYRRAIQDVTKRLKDHLSVCFDMLAWGLPVTPRDLLAYEEKTRPEMRKGKHPLDKELISLTVLGMDSILSSEIADFLKNALQTYGNALRTGTTLYYGEKWREPVMANIFAHIFGTRFAGQPVKPPVHFGVTSYPSYQHSLSQTMFKLIKASRPNSPYLGRYFVKYLGHTRNMSVYDMEKSTTEPIITVFSVDEYEIAFDGRHILFKTMGGIDVYELPTGKNKFKVNSFRGSSYKLSNSGRYVVVGTTKKVVIRDLYSEWEEEINGLCIASREVTFGQNDEYLIIQTTYSGPPGPIFMQIVTCYNLSIKSPLPPLQTVQDYYGSCRISHKDGGAIVSITQDEEVFQYDVMTGNKIPSRQQFNPEFVYAIFASA